MSIDDHKTIGLPHKLNGITCTVLLTAYIINQYVLRYSRRKKTSSSSETMKDKDANLKKLLFEMHLLFSKIALEIVGDDNIFVASRNPISHDLQL